MSVFSVMVQKRGGQDIEFFLFNAILLKFFPNILSRVEAGNEKNHHKLYINPLMYNIPKWSGTL